MARWILPAALALGITACAPPEPVVIYVTATPPATVQGAVAQVLPPVVPTHTLPPLSLSAVPGVLANNPTPDPTRPVSDQPAAQEYVVQPGDTLSGIAVTFNTTVPTLLELNGLDNPDVLRVGQVLALPGAPEQQSSAFKILPDSRFVRAPGSSAFDIRAFVAQVPGYIGTTVDLVDDQLLTGVQIVARIALEFSMDARLLLALLEYQAGWLSNPAPDDLARQYPLGTDREGLYRQLSWAANELSRGYYGWKGRGLTTLEFSDGLRLLYAPTLNAGTVAVQLYFSRVSPYEQWSYDVSARGFFATYYAYFGDPFQGAIDPLVPADLQQPELTFPFAPGETWFFTGGPHGGWGSGSAWAALDFAPPDDPQGVACYESQFWVTAVADGLIARSADGAVVLDLDGDGDETTGWTIFYLHIATNGRVASGTRVQAGDPIGHASCEGGFSTATHMHVARRYNGEWIPAACDGCVGDHARPAFVLSGWTVLGLEGQEYQGFLWRPGDQRQALQGRLSPDNRVSW